MRAPLPSRSEGVLPMPQFFEPLESRLFLSASGHKADSPTITADKQRITDAQAAIVHDNLACKAMLLTDRSSTSTTRASDQAVIRSDQLKIRTDRGNAAQEMADHLQLDADRLMLR